MPIDSELDISNESCPMTFVRTKVKLETMQPGQLLRVKLRGGEPMINVPRAVLDHGHSVIKTETLEDDLFELWIRVEK